MSVCSTCYYDSVPDLSTVGVVRCGLWTVCPSFHQGGDHTNVCDEQLHRSLNESRKAQIISLKVAVCLGTIATHKLPQGVLSLYFHTRGYNKM
jgi:hypothetical protein